MADTQTLSERRQSREIAARPTGGDAIEQVLIKGDLSALTPDQRNAYYMRLCDATGLNPLTQPFEYLKLNGKLVLYARKSCTDQLRALHGVSVVDMDQEEREGLYSVTVKVRDKHGREDMDIGSVNIGGLKGEARANAIMKASTKAKRRATLSICGLGLLDETEVETIPGAFSPAQEAAGGEPDPQSPPRQQRPAKVLNPETGHMIDPSSARQQKMNGTWKAVEDTIRGFDDLHELEVWRAKASTEREWSALAPSLQYAAEELYAAQQELLANKLKRELDEQRQR